MCELEIPNDFQEPPVIDFRVVTIPNWDSVLNEGSAIGPWNHIIQLDSEYTVTDGFTGESTTAISGTVQEKEQTVGVFEIRPASGLLIGIKFRDVGVCHKVWTALDSVKHFGDGGSREEWWSIPLEYGVRAEGSSFTSGGKSIWNTGELENNSINDVRDYMFKSAVLELDHFEDQVYFSVDGLLFTSDSSLSLSDVSQTSQMLEKLFIRKERRNDNRFRGFNQ